MKEKLSQTIEIIKKINLLLIIFLAFGVKNLIFSPNFASAAVLLVLGATYLGARHFKLKEPNKEYNKYKSDIDKMNADIKELKGAVSKGNIAKLDKKTRYFSS